MSEAESYPARIASTRTSLEDLKETLRLLREAMSVIDDDLNLKVLTTTDMQSGKLLFPNETASGIALRAMQRENAGWLECKAQIETVESNKVQLEIELERLRSEMREALVNKLAEVAPLAAEIVG